MDASRTSSSAPGATSPADRSNDPQALKDWYRQQEAQQQENEPDPAGALRGVGSLVGELRDYFGHYISARTDAIKLSLRNVAIFAVLGMLGLIAGAALITTAVVQLCLGLAQALAHLLGDRMWAGNLIVGALLLALIGIGAVVGLKIISSSSRKRTVAKYELRQHQQREQFGRDASERAAAAGKVAL